MRSILGKLAPSVVLGACLAVMTVHGTWAQELAREATDRSTRAVERMERPDRDGLQFEARRSVRINPQYRAGKIHRWFLGDEYRTVWADDVEMPVLDFDEAAGGLTVTGSAGGKQSTLLFLEGKDGREFVLRTIDKEAGGALPMGARRTIVESIAQDQISALNPYSAFVIAPLAEAAGLLYTDPVLVVVPDDPVLGEHREQFAGKAALLERKVDEDVSDVARFARPSEVIGTDDLYARLRTNPSARVDQKVFLRSRLFDMWIGDRDRHDAQYFWSVTDRRTRYLPLPIDRDFAFSRFDGLMNRVGRGIGPLEMKKLTYFGDDIDNLVGLNYQGAELDIRFTSELTRDDWLDVAGDLQERLTDAAIEEAISGWPEPVYEAIGRETIATLKARRADLAEAAEEYYELIMQKVDVVATDESERFLIDRMDDGTRVTISNGAGDAWYQRTFSRRETDQVRLYGLGGDDTFVVEGSGSEVPVIMIIGGAGDDALESETNRHSSVRFYDTRADEDVRSLAGFEEVDDSAGLGYTPHRYEFDRVAPTVSFDYDSDEGIYFGGGIKTTRYGFRSDPYAARHRIVANFAPQSRKYNVHYDGYVHDLVGGWDGRWEADVLDEEEFNDFYGLGNETPGTERQRERYLAHFRWVRAFPAFRHDLGPLSSLTLGPYLEYADIEPPSGFSETQPTSGFTPVQMRDQYFAGARARFEVDGRDSTLLPKQGLRWISEAGYHHGIRHGDERFARFASELSFFYTPPALDVATFAFRAGGATNVGDFTFYQANTVGGRENLRGFHRTRFSGRSSAYGNAELRVKLADLNVYLTRGELGLTGFYDVGRVWADDETSDLWHTGYGAGLWYTPFYRFAVTAQAGFSDEGRTVRVLMGMFF